jgi:hypothetical protein
VTYARAPPGSRAPAAPQTRAHPTRGGIDDEHRRDTRGHLLPPYQACVSCERGDIETVVVVAGHVDWIVAYIERVGDVSHEEAREIFDGDDSERMCGPDGYGIVGIRLCRACAERTGATVIEERRIGREHGRYVDVQPGLTQSELAKFGSVECYCPECQSRV